MAGGTIAVRFVGDVTWAPGLPPVLSAVNFTAHRGELVAVVGATGSGKTALLYGLLGLTDRVHGNRVIVKGSTAFVAQQAFIFGGACPCAVPLCVRVIICICVLKTGSVVYVLFAQTGRAI